MHQNQAYIDIGRSHTQEQSSTNIFRKLAFVNKYYYLTYTTRWDHATVERKPMYDS